MAVNTSAWSDPRYQKASRDIQEGAWRSALDTLHDLQRDYPQQEEIRALIENTQIRVELEQKPVSGLSPLAVMLLHRRRLSRVGVAVLVFLVLMGGWYGYQRMVEPARQVRRAQLALINTLNQAQTLLAQSAYSEAAAGFEKVLTFDPQNEEASVGLAEAQQQLVMAEQYQEAVHAAERGETIEALALFQDLRDQNANYKDVSDRIEQLLQVNRIEDIFAQAEAAYAEGRWSDAILLYNTIRQENVTYRLETVELHLFESYMAQAGNKMKSAGLSLPEIGQTAELYRRALSIRPRDTLAQANLALLSQYQQARESMAQERYDQSTPMLSAIYANDPGLLGGDARRALFDSRMGYGAQLEGNGDLLGALAQYTAAALLPVENSNSARLKILAVKVALAPTPTPTATVTPTPTPDAFAEIMKIMTPTPSPLEQFTGWIAFRSDRPGSPHGLWVMRPDGSEQQPVRDSTKLYAHLKEQVTWSQDNQRRIWVEQDGQSGKSVAIYMWRYDVPAHWREARVELLNNSGINYHPTFSPDEQSIAFTSQRHAGPTDGDWGLWGDEIFIIYFSDYNSSGYVQPRRLTHNDWEWDKHPTFSPDGQTIAFWSNRISGRAQIWAMNVDGSDQRNLSNNEWNDWDPVWILPRRELPDIREENGIGPAFDPALLELGE